MKMEPQMEEDKMERKKKEQNLITAIWMRRRGELFPPSIV